MSLGELFTCIYLSEKKVSATFSCLFALVCICLHLLLEWVLVFISYYSVTGEFLTGSGFPALLLSEVHVLEVPKNCLVR